MTAQNTPMTKEQVIAKMVGNYYRQGGNGQEPMTLEEYLRGIMFSPTKEAGDNPWGEYAEADLAYGLSLSRQK